MTTRLISGRTYMAGDVLYPNMRSAKAFQRDIKKAGYYAVVIRQKNGYRVWAAERFRLVKRGKK